MKDQKSSKIKNKKKKVKTKEKDGMQFSGKKLRIARTKAKYSREELAKKIDSNYSVIWKYEVNNMMPNEENLSLLSKALDMKPEDFFTNADIENNKLKLAIDTSQVSLSMGEKDFVYFFMTRPRVEQERLLGILQGILLAGSVDDVDNTLGNE